MERIAFSLAGEGRGHAARAVALSQALRDRYDIVYFCPDPVREFILKHIPDAVIEPIPALTFVKNGHGIDYLRTMVRTLRQFRSRTRDIAHLAGRIRELEVTVLISDFEPYASWAAARCDIPVLNLNHPGVILKFLSVSPVAWVAQGVATLMMPPAQKTLICSFYRGDVGPIIRDELRRGAPARGDYYLVYVKDSSRNRVESVLSRFPDQRFHVFPDRGSDFTAALLGCRGVIAPAGHQLLSESMFLGKPVLAIPQLGHFEQRLNARMLRVCGRGRQGRIRTLEKDLSRFIEEIDSFPRAVTGLEPFRFTDDTMRTVSLIEQFVREHRRFRVLPRRQYNWFLTIPEKLAALRRLRATWREMLVG